MMISLIIPAYNEEKTIGKVIEDTFQAMETLGMPYEIIVAHAQELVFLPSKICVKIEKILNLLY